jgi:hypothetical protein
MVMDPYRGVRHSVLQYLADRVREAECERLVYMTRLSKLHTPDPPLAIAFPWGAFGNTGPHARK